jgi:predicted amidohydrolase
MRRIARRLDTPLDRVTFLDNIGCGVSGALGVAPSAGNAMKRLRVAIDQMAPRLGDIDANVAAHRKSIAWARRQKADLLVFPELSLTGYLVMGMVSRVALAPTDPVLIGLARDAGTLGVILGFVEKAPDGRFYNSAACLKDGAVQTVQRKLFLPTYGMFDEKRFFAEGDRIESFDAPWGRTGILICNDALHPAAAYLHEQAGAQLIVTISVSPARGIGPDGSMTGREIFRIAHRAHSWLLGLPTVFVNRVGTEEGLTFWGGSQVLDPQGEALCQLPEYEPARGICEIDLEATARARTRFPHLKEGRPDFIVHELWRLRMGPRPPFGPSGSAH